ncbi:DNA damage responsive protein [Desmophyllum pertusum]|uniref:DNA damage responsive protein n=1 Tax=Desmophyllum pertusum TaxID=174260 RepID=A0A9W9YEW4_9CNID|nr:DNA damage responsive protein [Desmophyllum pertusum]
MVLPKKHFLSSGLGMLTDGSLAPEDYVDTDGLGWIGWNAKDTPTPYIIFEFLDTRIFHSMTIHCNVRDRTKIKLFSQVEVSFNVDGVAFDASLTYKPKNVSSGSSG